MLKLVPTGLGQFKVMQKTRTIGTVSTCQRNGKTVYEFFDRGIVIHHATLSGLQELVEGKYQTEEK